MNKPTKTWKQRPTTRTNLYNAEEETRTNYKDFPSLAELILQ